MGAIDAARVWQRSIEEAAQEDQRTIDAYLRHYKRAAERLVEGPAEDLPLLGGSLSEVALSVMASHDEAFSAQANSPLEAYENFRRRSQVRPTPSGGRRSIERFFLGAQPSDGLPRGRPVPSAVATDVAAALVWGGHSSEAWELIDALPEILIAGVRKKPSRSIQGISSRKLWPRS